MVPVAPGRFVFALCTVGFIVRELIMRSQDDKLTGTWILATGLQWVCRGKWAIRCFNGEQQKKKSPLLGLLYLYCHCGHCVLHVSHASCAPSHLISVSCSLSASFRTVISTSGVEQRNTLGRLSSAGASHWGQKGKTRDSKWNMCDLYWAAQFLINLLHVFFHGEGSACTLSSMLSQSAVASNISNSSHLFICLKWEKL